MSKQVGYMLINVFGWHFGGGGDRGMLFSFILIHK